MTHNLFITLWPICLTELHCKFIVSVMTSSENVPRSYAEAGVDYDKLDGIKRTAQVAARSTSAAMNTHKMRVIEASRGESAFVWDEGARYGAMVMEALGTKHRIADAARRSTGRTYYDAIGQDLVAMAVNDLIVVGARPTVLSNYVGMGDPSWGDDIERYEDLFRGLANSCRFIDVVMAGGETAMMGTGLDEVELAASVVGYIEPKSRLTLGDKLQAGDAIVFVESSGMHANGATFSRLLADRIPEGYDAKLSDGRTYAEALLTPTHLYPNLVHGMFEAGVDIHYMANITGHGWSKLMRADRDLRYFISDLPPVDPLFEFIQRRSGVPNEEMYYMYNMGAGFAFYLPEAEVEKAIQVGGEHNLRMMRAGHVEEGKKEVHIAPLNITYDKLGVRAA